MKRPMRKSRGFAMLAAIAMLAVVAAVLAALTGQFGGEIRRTRRAFQDAQLRQLLHAGAQDAIERARSWDGAPKAGGWTVQLPQPLAGGDGARVRSQVHSMNETQADIEIEAHFDDRTATQVLHLTRSGGTWSAAGAELNL